MTAPPPARAPTRVHTITTRITGHGYTAALPRAGLPRGRGSATNAQPIRRPVRRVDPRGTASADPHRAAGTQNRGIPVPPSRGRRPTSLSRTHLPLKPRASGHAPSHGGPAVTDHPTGPPRTRAEPDGRRDGSAEQRNPHFRDVAVAHTGAAGGPFPVRHPVGGCSAGGGRDSGPGHRGAVRRGWSNTGYDGASRAGCAARMPRPTRFSRLRAVARAARCSRT